MANEHPGHFLKEWRNFAGLSQTAACEKGMALFEDRVLAEGEEAALKGLGLTQGNLSKIENGTQPYNQRLLEVLAEVYGTDPASLIMRNPSDPDGIWSIYDQIPQPQRKQALQVISGVVEGLKKMGASG